MLEIAFKEEAIFSRMSTPLFVTYLISLQPAQHCGASKISMSCRMLFKFCCLFDAACCAILSCKK